METFNQLLEIDDDDEHDFSKGLAKQYMEQADTTFVEMDQFLAQKNLSELSKKGHFLKGSSASVGLKAVSGHCASIQNLGSLKDESGAESVTADVALAKIAEIVPILRVEQAKAKKWLSNFYGVKDW